MSERVMFEAQSIDVFYGASQILFGVSLAVVGMNSLDPVGMCHGRAMLRQSDQCAGFTREAERFRLEIEIEHALV